MLSPIAAEHVQRPRNAGPFEGATHVGYAGVPGEGPYCVIHLRIAGGRIERAGYETNGCPSAIACASVLCQLATGREAARAGLIEPAELVLVMGGVPPGKEDCAERATRALKDALQVEQDDSFQ